MEWQQILGFYHVVRLGSFTKAAEVTFRTQSALSQQIKALEGELDCQLLERIGKRKLRLTSAGERFWGFAETVLATHDRLQEQLHELKGLQKGHLRMAAPFTTLYHLCRTPLKKYVQQFPQVQLTILDRSQPRVMELTKAGDIDFGLALESMVPKDLATLRWKEVEMVLMTPHGHPLAEGKRVTMRQIAKYPLILPPKNLKSSGRKRLEEEIQKLGLAYHTVMESSNVELSSLYVEMGLGISFATIARGVPIPQQRRVALIPLRRYFKPDYLAVVMRKDKILSPPQSAFLQMLMES